MCAQEIWALGVFWGGAEVEVEGEGRCIREEGLCKSEWVRLCV